MNPQDKLEKSRDELELYTCLLCNVALFFEEIALHPCMHGLIPCMYLKELHHFILQHQYNTQDKENLSENTFVKANEGSQVMEEILILAVQERPPLWNYKDCPLNQRTKAAKDRLWEEVQLIINPNKANPQYTTTFCKSKWKNLLDTYKIYLAKEKTSSGQSAKPTKPWRFMNQMNFIKDTIDIGIKKTVSNMPKDEVNAVLDSDLELADTSIDERPNKRQKIDSIDKIAAALAAPIQIPQINFPARQEEEAMDEISHFCSAMDKKLHKFDAKKASLVMLKMHELLFKIENDMDI